MNAKDLFSLLRNESGLMVQTVELRAQLGAEKYICLRNAAALAMALNVTVRIEHNYVYTIDPDKLLKIIEASAEKV